MSDDPDCLGMCAIDGDVCTGCGRTLDQINAALDCADVVFGIANISNGTRTR